MSNYALKLIKGLEAKEVSNATAATTAYRRLEARTDGWYDIDDAGVVTRLAGGTGNIEAGTANGQMAFWNNTAALWEHSATDELFWDDSGKEFGVGISAPGAKLHVKSIADDTPTAIFEHDGSAATYGVFILLRNDAGADSVIGHYDASHATLANYTTIEGHSTNPVAIITNATKQFWVEGDGGVFAANIAAGTSANIIYFDSSTKEFKYGAAPAGSSLWTQGTGEIHPTSTTDNILFAAGNELNFFDTTNSIYAAATNLLSINGGTKVAFKIGDVGQMSVNDGAFLPTTNNDIDLGSDALEFKDLWIDGTAYLDNLTLTSGATVDIIATTITNVDDEIPTCGAVVDYVQTQIGNGGIDWQDSVLDIFDNTSALPTPVTAGDRYIALVTGNGWTANNIYTAITTSWSGAIEFVPTEGAAAWVEDVDSVYIFNGTNWVLMGSLYSIAHNDTTSKQGGTTNEYYHLTSAQNSLVAGITSTYTELNYLDGTVPTNTYIMYGDGSKILGAAGLTWTIGSTLFTVTGSETITGNLSLPASATAYLYFGSASVDGSWRVSVTAGGELIFETRSSGTWYISNTMSY